MNTQRIDFCHQLCKNISSQLALDLLIQECESRLVYSPWPSILSKRLTKKFNSKPSKSKLKGFFEVNSINIEEVDIHILSKKVLSQFEASKLDFSTVKPLLDLLSNMQDHLIRFGMAHILAITLEFRYKSKNDANSKMIKIFIKTCKYLKKNHHNIEDIQKENLDKECLDKSDGCRKRIKLIVDDLEEEERLDRANQNEIRNNLFSEQSKIFEKLQPLGFLDKISLEGFQDDFSVVDTIEIDEILSDL